MDTDITIDNILDAYACGYFPMADSADSPDFYWYNPEMRGQLSITGLHVPKRLRRTALAAPFEIRVDTVFADVIEACAQASDTRKETWINPAIRDCFIKLYDAGYAHSVECWQDGKLAGGLYGLALGGVFCGESMFSKATDASKIALLHLCARLWKAGFSVLDTQYVNPHLEQFGVYEVSRDLYLEKLQTALQARPDFLLSAQMPVDEQALLRMWLETIA